jgi:hypothetical protein
MPPNTAPMMLPLKMNLRNVAPPVVAFNAIVRIFLASN